MANTWEQRPFRTPRKQNVDVSNADRYPARRPSLLTALLLWVVWNGRWNVDAEVPQTPRIVGEPRTLEKDEMTEGSF